MPRMFALLEHTTHAGVHWDLLIEYAPGSPLATWRLLANPLDGHMPIAAERIADHRSIYLTYAGPISGDRGSVRRLDGGESSLEIDAQNANVWLRGNSIRGGFVFRSARDSLLFDRVE